LGLIKSVCFQEKQDENKKPSKTKNKNVCENNQIWMVQSTLEMQISHGLNKIMGPFHLPQLDQQLFSQIKRAILVFSVALTE